jgi:hypothetical protein
VADPRIGKADEQRELARARSHIDDMVTPVQGGNGNHRLAIVLRFAFRARGPGRVVQIRPVGVLPGLLHAQQG